MPFLRFYLGLNPAAAAGTCIIAVFFTTLGGSIKHYKLNNMKLRPVIPVIASGSLFTVFLSIIFVKAAQREIFLDTGIGTVFFLISGRMLFEGTAELLKTNFSLGISDLTGRTGPKLLIGAISGILPGILGIGTGAILVPAFRFILKAPLKMAIGSSLVCFSVNAFISSSFKIFQGFADIKTALLLSVGTLLGANIGAIVNKKSPDYLLKLLFGTLFFIIAMKYIRIF